MPKLHIYVSIADIMKFLLPIFALTAFVATCPHNPAVAQSSFLEVKCLPENGVSIFDVRVIDAPGLNAFLNTGRGSDLVNAKEREEFLNQQGIYSTKNFRIECILPKHKYELIGSRSPAKAKGMCGASSEIFASMKIDGKPAFHNKSMSPSCLEPKKSYITHIHIDEFIPGWGGKSFIQKSGSDLDPQIVFFVDGTLPSVGWGGE